MAQLICRLPWQGSIPDARIASKVGITAWLLPVRWSRSGGLQLGVHPDNLLAAIPGTRFSLELLLGDQLTPDCVILGLFNKNNARCSGSTSRQGSVIRIFSDNGFAGAEAVASSWECTQTSCSRPYPERDSALSCCWATR